MMILLIRIDCPGVKDVIPFEWYRTSYMNE